VKPKSKNANKKPVTFSYLPEKICRKPWKAQESPFYALKNINKYKSVSKRFLVLGKPIHHSFQHPQQLIL
jgi:hypothetical protein